MALPNFICPGAAKAGTTSLYEILLQHPDVYLSTVNKEAHFFDYDENYSKGLQWYQSTFFGGYNNQAVIGDITPLYMYLSQAVERIHKDLGKDLRIVFMLRDPVERAFSHYKFNIKRSYEDKTFKEAVMLEPDRIKTDFFHRMHHSYIDRGMYALQIKRFLKFYPKENMHFITFEEDFMNNRQRTIERLLEFLNLSAVELQVEKHANATSLPKSKWVNELHYKPTLFRSLAKKVIPSYELRRKISRYIRRNNEKPAVFEKVDSAFRQELIDMYFRNDITDLQSIINRDLSQWLK
jgi:hypothetical protein